MVLALAACGGPDAMDKVDQYLLTSARTAEQNQDYASAARHYATLYESNQDDLQIAESLARNLRHSGRAADARRLLEDLLARLGPNSRLLLERGKVEIALGRADLAVQTLSQAEPELARDWELPATLAIAFDRQGRFDEAAERYRQAHALFPESPDILNNHALSRALAGRLDQALDLLRQAVALPGAKPQVRENLAYFQALYQPVQAQPAPAPVPVTPKPVKAKPAKTKPSKTKPKPR
jgi:Flp pilus assembly protein TadD